MTTGERPLPRGRRWQALGIMLVFVLGALLATFVASPVHAQDTERITAFDVTITILPDGDLAVVERIEYDFGALDRRGIFRNIPSRFHYDEQYDRVMPITVLEVDSESGAPDQYLVDELNGETSIRIGDPDETITGAHVYLIRYRVEGALNGFGDHDELYWNATGNEWEVPIEQVTVRVETPAEIQEAACFAGLYGSNRSCDAVMVTDAISTFTQSGLRPYEGVTVVVAIPAGAVPTPAPILVERWSLTRAFTLSPLTIGITSALGLLVVGGVLRTLWLVGRDRRWSGSLVDARFGTASGAAERVPLFEGGPFPVEYSPPGDLRPGLIGTLRDEEAHPLDATATIIDLATRRYLSIEEIRTSGLLGDRTDWKLVRLPEPHGRPLLAYERLLLDALFEDGDEVEISNLRQKFRARLDKVQAALYEEMVRQGWYRHSPRSTRHRWLALGIVGLIASVGIFIAAIAFTEWALIPIPLIVGAIALIAGHNATPARTPQGSATLRRIRGFERFIASAELYRARFAEQSRVFYDYLPYAVVFGLTEQWARAFEGLADLPEADWYVGRHLAVASLADSITRFSRESAGAIAATPASSGSSGFGGGGFSGGGGGGGGGGSW